MSGVMCSHRLLSASEERELLSRSHAGDRSARDALVLHNQRLVDEIAKMRLNSRVKRAGCELRGMTLQDLIGWGQLGLLKAIDRFDLSQPVKFSTFAWRLVNQAMSNAERDVKKDAGRVVYPGEYQDDRRVEKSHGMAADANSLYTAIDEREPATYEPDMIDKARWCLALLPEKQRAVVELLFGFDPRGPLIKHEIGPLLGYSHQNAQQTEQRAMKRLREYFGVGALDESEAKRLQEIY